MKTNIKFLDLSETEVQLMADRIMSQITGDYEMPGSHLGVYDLYPKILAALKHEWYQGRQIVFNEKNK
jgi:hypothetical protein